MLTQKQITSKYLYSDGKLLYRDGWRAGTEAGRLHKSGYRQVHTNGKIYLSHRLIFLYCHGWLPDEVEHSDQNKTNNSVANLRPATRSQNKYNVAITKANTSGYKGVHRAKTGKPWVATIKVSGKFIRLGAFDVIEQAAEAYDRAAIHYAGEFAYTNFKR